MAVYRICRLVKFLKVLFFSQILTVVHAQIRLRPVKRSDCPLPEAITDTKGLRGRPKIGLLMVWEVDRNWPDALMEV